MKSYVSSDSAINAKPAIGKDPFCPANSKYDHKAKKCALETGFFKLESCNLDNKMMGFKYTEFGKITQLHDPSAALGTDQVHEVAMENVKTISDISTFKKENLFEGYSSPTISMVYDKANKKVSYYYAMKFAAEAQNDIFLTNDIFVTFQCDYPLGEQDISQDIEVAQKAITSDFVASGTIPYSITANAPLEVGSNVEFTITPLQEDTFYAKLVKCEVHNDADDKKHEVYPKCDSFLKVTHKQDAATKGPQTIAYNIFRWALADAVEKQKLICTLDVSYEPNATMAQACPASSS